jgi:hypothetical protein
MERIDFYQNWNNKLSCDAFSTLRLHNKRKYVKGQRYEICLNGKRLGVAELHVKRTFVGTELNEFIARIDTGKSLKDLRALLGKMYKNIFAQTKKTVEAAIWDYLCLQWVLKYDSENENDLPPAQSVNTEKVENVKSEQVQASLFQ